MQRVDNARFGVAHPRDCVDGAHASGEQALIARILAVAEADFEFGVEARFPVDNDAPGSVDTTGAAFGQSRREVVRHPVDVFDGDDLLAVDDADAFAYVAPMVPASMTPQAVSSRRGVGRNSHSSRISSSWTPSASATMVTAAPQPHVNTPGLLQAPLIIQGLAESEQHAHVELDGYCE